MGGESDGLSLGESMRAAREAKGSTLEQTARSLRIRLRYLEAIEEDRFTDLPPRPYPEIFLSSYAKWLGMSATEVLDRYCTDTGEEVNKVEKLWEEADEETPARKAGPMVGIAVAALIVLAIVVLLLARS